ncbi:MAG: methionyl-tRNA formyltransferase [Rhizobiales bacterium]|nr:methionyl-tRNA formyltransferase [Hyphomicrobiales bacterium]
MRIVVHGQQAFGKAVLERLLDRGENVVGVFGAPDKEGRPRDPLAAYAAEKGLPVHQPKSWRTPEAEALIRSFDADVCMMAYVLLFVPENIRNAPRLGSFQYHPSLLPMHRGPSSINWPIAKGAKRTGLTIFWPDDGLDEGPILLQKECEIGPDETLGDVYFKKLFPMGVDAMIEALDLVKAGSAPRIVQDLSKGSYESWFGRDEAKIDWSRPANEIYDLIRAGNPQPGTWTTWKGETLQVFDSARIEGETGGAPGEVLSVSNEGIRVAASGGAVLMKRVRFGKGEKSPAGDVAGAAGIAVGARLGS